MNRTLRDFWDDYKSEFFFGLIVLAILVPSYWLSNRFIPGVLFDRWLWPLMNASLAAVCFFGAWLCLKHNDDNRLRVAWAVTLILWGLVETMLVIGVILYDISIVKAGTEKLTGDAMIVGSIFGWLLFIYPFEALNPRYLKWWRSLLQLLPLPVLAILDYLLPMDLRVLIGLYPVGLMGVLLAQIHKYRQWCEDNFSTMEDIDSQWIVRYMVMLVIAGGSFFWLCVSSNPSRGFTQDLYLLFMIAYTTERVLSRPDPWKVMKSLPAVVDESEEISLSDARKRLEEWVGAKKPFLSPDFQLMDLQQVLPLNRTYLSQLINTEYDCSFYQWVNSLRVEEAKKQLMEYPESKIQDIAEHCGFSSRRVFTQVFIRETGVKPSEWTSKG